MNIIVKETTISTSLALLQKKLSHLASSHGNQQHVVTAKVSMYEQFLEACHSTDRPHPLASKPHPLTIATIACT